MKFIILDLKVKKPLYGRKEKTLLFSTEEIAKEVADQFYETPDEYLIIPITL